MSEPELNSVRIATIKNAPDQIKIKKAGIIDTVQKTEISYGYTSSDIIEMLPVSI
jgi:hypothetical protein